MIDKKSFTKYASVILEVSINKTLDYGIPSSLVASTKPGVKVEVPLRGKPKRGYVLEIKDKTSFSPVLPINKIVSDDIIITEDLFRLAVWISKYYCAPLWKVLKVLLPSSIRRDTKPKEQLYVTRRKSRDVLRELCQQLRHKNPAQAAVLDVMLLTQGGILLSELLEKAQVSRSPVTSLEKQGILATDSTRVDRSPLVDAEYFKTKPKQLNKEQFQALENICNSLEGGRYETHMIYGVTGSGKTEVYLQAIDKALSLGKGAIMLVPEIALTTQTIERFRSRFEGRIAILHYRLSHGERFDEWQRILHGEANIVIGARSGVFSPVKNLGLLIVDEEHEQSYKQSDESPCYHARDVAVMRGAMLGATVILGSATPSLESYTNTLKGKYKLSTLLQRADTAQRPSVTVVDMHHEFKKAQGFTIFSDALLDAIKKRKDVGEQTILFLNRRGYHTAMLCQSCNTVVSCPHCSVSLTYHRSSKTLTCHLCGFTIPLPQRCPSCNSYDTMKFRGIGTEQVERALHRVLSDVRTLRIDADTTRHKGSHYRLFRSFASGKADVLIGTQMIAKGLHFPQVTLVGVLNSDLSLNIPDFRASESVFQLITQVSGRSGRASLPGEVIIQTHLPESSVIKHASQQDYTSFFQEEMSSRQAFDYPPFTHLAKFKFSGHNEQQTLRAAQQFHQTLNRQVVSRFTLNPVIACGHAKVKDKYYFQFLARGHDIYFLNRSVENVQSTCRLPSKVRLTVDIDPISTYF